MTNYTKYGRVSIGDRAIPESDIAETIWATQTNGMFCVEIPTMWYGLYLVQKN